MENYDNYSRGKHPRINPLNQCRTEPPLDFIVAQQYLTCFTSQKPAILELCGLF